MPGLKLIKNNLNGGEISPYSLGRTDLERYNSCCEKINNWIPSIQGGVSRRPGMRFITSALGPSRLIPFVFSLDAAYVLEFGNGLIQFYRNQGQISSGTQPSWNPTIAGLTNDLSPLVWQNIGRPAFALGFGYSVGVIILDANGNLQQCTVPGAATIFNAWSTVRGGITVQGIGGSISTWICLGPPLTWQSSTVYTFGSIPILDTNNNIQKVAFPGTSATAPPYQVSTPYNTATDNLWDIKFAQVGNTMYLVHPNHPPMKLSRISDTNWILSTIGFYAPPTHTPDQSINGGTVTLSLSATGPAGAVVTATASAPIFIDGDVGKGISIGNGVGIGFITAIGGTTATDPTTGATLNQTATLTIVDPYTTTSLGTTWLMRGSPNTFLAFGSIGAGPLWNYTRKRGYGGPQTGFSFRGYPVDQVAPPVQEDAFRVQDAGTYVVVDGAVLYVNSVVNSTQIKCTQITSFSVIVGVGTNSVQVPDAASGGEWSLQLPAFTSSDGYPQAICFAQDRLWLGSTITQPQTIWGSAIDDFENFGIGTLDNNALSFTMSSGRFEQILWMQAFQGSIVAGTYAGEYLINGGGSAITGNSSAITPTNVNVLLQSTYGTANIQPLVVQNDLIYVQRGKKTLYQFTFNIYQSVYASKNLNLLNNLVTMTGFKEMLYAETPFFTGLFVDNSNNLTGLVYEKMNDVWGWYRLFTGIDAGDGVVSVCTIPTISAGISADEIWLVTQRTLDGVVSYSIEWLDSTLNLDCSSHNIFATPVTQIGNLEYLDGRPVTVVVDNQVLPTKIMDGTGIYVFPPGFSGLDVSAGINYSADILTVRPEVSAGGQTIQGLLKGWDVLFARMYSTIGLTLNGQEMSFRTPGDQQTPSDDSTEIEYGPNVFGEAVTPFSGDFRINLLGDDRDARVTLSQPQPLPANVLALFGQLEVGNM